MINMSLIAYSVRININLRKKFISLNNEKNQLYKMTMKQIKNQNYLNNKY